MSVTIELNGDGGGVAVTKQLHYEQSLTKREGVLPFSSKIVSPQTYVTRLTSVERIPLGDGLGQRRLEATVRVEGSRTHPVKAVFTMEAYDELFTAQWEEAKEQLPDDTVHYVMSEFNAQAHNLLLGVEEDKKTGRLYVSLVALLLPKTLAKTWNLQVAAA